MKKTFCKKSKKKLDIHMIYMYIISMAVSERMKPVTVNFNELKYLMFQQMAVAQNRKAAELVREAMDEYLKNHAVNHGSLENWEPLSLGGIKAGAKDWASKDFQDEMLEAKL